MGNFEERTSTQIFQKYKPDLTSYKNNSNPNLLEIQYPLIWTHKNNESSLSEYEYDCHSQKQVQKITKIFMQRVNSSTIANTKYIRLIKRYLASSVGLSIRIFYQRVIGNLSCFKEIPFQDCIYFYWQALAGFGKLKELFGCFRVTQEMFHINQNGQLKVWCHRNIFEQQISPQNYLYEDQKRMVREVIDIIENNTDKRQNKISIRSQIIKLNINSFDEAIHSFQKICQMNSWKKTNQLSSLKNYKVHQRWPLFNNYPQKIVKGPQTVKRGIKVDRNPTIMNRTASTAVLKNSSLNNSQCNQRSSMKKYIEVCASQQKKNRHSQVHQSMHNINFVDTNRLPQQRSPIVERPVSQAIPPRASIIMKPKELITRRNSQGNIPLNRQKSDSIPKIIISPPVTKPVQPSPKMQCQNQKLYPKRQNTQILRNSISQQKIVLDQKHNITGNLEINRVTKSFTPKEVFPLRIQKQNQTNTSGSIFERKIQQTQPSKLKKVSISKAFQNLCFTENASIINKINQSDVKSPLKESFKLQTIKQIEENKTSKTIETLNVNICSEKENINRDDDQDSLSLSQSKDFFERYQQFKEDHILTNRKNNECLFTDPSLYSYITSYRQEPVSEINQHQPNEQPKRQNFNEISQNFSMQFVQSLKLQDKAKKDKYFLYGKDKGYASPIFNQQEQERIRYNLQEQIQQKRQQAFAGRYFPTVTDISENRSINSSFIPPAAKFHNEELKEKKYSQPYIDQRVMEDLVRLRRL